jgi:1,4-dihydroxy-2-naphthoate octaprenyltransferase
MLGAGMAYAAGGTIDINILLLVLVGSLAAHIAVNALNEYQDYQSGLDLNTERTPFSGGSGTLPDNPQLAPTAYRISQVAISVTILCGLLLVYLQGAGLLVFGLLGIALILLYTRVINRYPMLCLLAPGFGFGTLMVGGTYYALTGTITWQVLLVSMIPFFLVSNLLLLNQFPDVEADRGAGRNHLLIHHGLQASTRVYLLLLLLAGITLVAAVLVGALPVFSLLGLLAIAAGIPIYRAVSRDPRDIESLLPYMGMNVGLVLLTPVVVGVGLFY